MGVLGLHPSWYINVNLVICHSPPIMRQPFCLFASMLKIPLFLFVLCCTLLAGCGANGPALKPFKMDIQQGNVVTSKMLLQLKPGMTKSQVRFIMGTPLIVDSFHKDRWDYFYQMRQAGKIVEQRRVILDFDKELLTKVRGDVVPQGTVGAAKEADVSDLSTLNAPIMVEPKPKEASMKEVNVWDRLKFWKKDEKLLAKSEVNPARVKRNAAASVETSTVVAPMVLAVAEEASLKAAKPEAANVNLKNIEVEKNLPENLTIKTLPAKNMLENNSLEKNSLDKSGSKISWLESLKFWKKNNPTEAETAALDEAKAETAASAAKNVAQDSASVSQATAPESQSILVVPIELPNAEAAKEGVNTHAIVAEEPVTAKPLQTEPLNTKKAPAITGKESMKTFKSPSQKMLPAKPEFIKPMPAKPAVPSSVFKKPMLQKPAPVDSQLSRPLKPLSLEPKKGEQLIFRMDKTLNLARNLVANPQVMPELANMVPDATTLNANTLGANKLDVNKLNVNKLDTATLNATTLDTALLPVKTAETQPVEAEPSFFDKMLEKIGF